MERQELLSFEGVKQILPSVSSQGIFWLFFPVLRANVISVNHKKRLDEKVMIYRFDR